jgi:hypothetical protein
VWRYNFSSLFYTLYCCRTLVLSKLLHGIYHWNIIPDTRNSTTDTGYVDSANKHPAVNSLIRGTASVYKALETLNYTIQQYIIYRYGSCRYYWQLCQICIPLDELIALQSVLHCTVVFNENALIIIWYNIWYDILYDKIGYDMIWCDVMFYDMIWYIWYTCYLQLVWHPATVL